MGCPLWAVVLHHRSLFIIKCKCKKYDKIEKKWCPFLFPPVWSGLALEAKPVQLKSSALVTPCASPVTNVCFLTK